MGPHKPRVLMLAIHRVDGNMPLLPGGAIAHVRATLLRDDLKGQKVGAFKAPAGDDSSM